MKTGQKSAARRTSASKLVPSQRVQHLPSLAEIMKAPMGRAAIEKLVEAGMKQRSLELAVQSTVWYVLYDLHGVWQSARVL
jgi:hypothetical protein